MSTDTMYDAKVKQVADAISPHVKFDTVEQAREFQTSYRLPESTPVPRQIHNMAKVFTSNPRKVGVAHFIDPDVANRTTISMFSEAIRLCAERYVMLYELEELASLGNIDRRRMSAIA